MYKKTIAFDFDGVIHSYEDGWKDGSIYGEINDNLLNYMYSLLKNYSICIYSVRSAKQIKEYLEEHCKFKSSPLGKLEFEEMPLKVPCFWNKENIIGVTNMKPGAVLYVDDKAINFTPFAKIRDGLDYLKDRIEG